MLLDWLGLASEVKQIDLKTISDIFSDTTLPLEIKKLIGDFNL
jgi:hypothetical protein